LKVRFKESFVRDLRALKEKALRGRIRTLIEDVERASSLGEVANLKKLRSGGAYYRIRIGDYRVGVALEEDVAVFVRMLHRREIYRYFP
jgi:mRNA interferase RelE/StbE